MRVLAAFAVVLSLAAGHAREDAIARDSVVVIPLHGPVSEAQFFFLRRALKQADAAGAAAVILDIDTPGGALAATEKIDQALLKARVPVFSYINANAASAGALIALATKGIYMAPVSAIGAAAPVMSSGQEMEATMSKKVVSYYSGYFRSVATQNAHNPELVDAFMNLDKEVKIGDRILNPKGALLTLSAQEATEVIDGRPVLAQGIARTVGEVAQQAGFAQEAIVRVEPSGFESIAQWITLLAPLFLMGGIIGAYIEFKSPGFGVARILAALSFLLFFAGHYIAGLTGFEVVAVFFLGVLFVVVEFTLFPGLVVLAALGTILMMGALFFAMVDFYPGTPTEISFDLLAVPVLNLTLAILLAAVTAALVTRFLPELPIFNRLILVRSTGSGPALTPPPEALFSQNLSVGDEGVAVTMLRPAGKADFQGVLADVQSEGEFLPAGTRIRIQDISGSSITVERGV